MVDDQKNSTRRVFFDWSALTLLVSNIIVVILAVSEHWQIGAFLWA